MRIATRFLANLSGGYVDSFFRTVAWICFQSLPSAFAKWSSTASAAQRTYKTGWSSLERVQIYTGLTQVSRITSEEPRIYYRRTKLTGFVHCFIRLLRKFLRKIIKLTVKILSSRFNGVHFAFHKSFVTKTIFRIQWATMLELYVNAAARLLMNHRKFCSAKAEFSQCRLLTIIRTCIFVIGSNVKNSSIFFRTKWSLEVRFDLGIASTTGRPKSGTPRRRVSRYSCRLHNLVLICVA